jgi:hypothetical protein
MLDTEGVDDDLDIAGIQASASPSSGDEFDDLCAIPCDTESESDDLDIADIVASTPTDLGRIDDDFLDPVEFEEAAMITPRRKAGRPWHLSHLESLGAGPVDTILVHVEPCPPLECWRGQLVAIPPVGPHLAPIANGFSGHEQWFQQLSNVFVVSARDDARLDDDCVRIANSGVVTTGRFTTLTQLCEQLGTLPQKTRTSLRRIAACMLIQDRLDRLEVERYFASNFMKTNLIAYNDDARYDETPLSVRAKHALKEMTAVAEHHDNELALPLQIAWARKPSTSLVASKGIRKIVQYEGHFGFVVKLGIEYYTFIGSSLHSLGAKRGTVRQNSRPTQFAR